MTARQIVLDTETTGLSVEEGHRIVEIGCLEIVNRRVTNRRFHCYLNPDREIDAGALEVHGISRDKLQEAPRFADVVVEFIEFVRGAEVLIHNAAFDVGFIDRELELLGSAWGRLRDYCGVVDTLLLARERHPGQRNSLDALCKRYEIENAHRTLHGALLDAELLADVYLAMTGGQGALGLDATEHAGGAGEELVETPAARVRGTVLSLVATPDEMAEHEARLAVIDKRSGGKCLWLAAGR